MKKVHIVMIVAGLIVILFAAFCPAAKFHTVLWRISIGLAGCFSFISGVYKTVCQKQFGQSDKSVL